MIVSRMKQSNLANGSKSLCRVFMKSVKFLVIRHEGVQLILVGVTIVVSTVIAY